VVRSAKAGLVVNVVQAVLAVHSANTGLVHELHEQQNPPCLNVPLKQPELHEQLKLPELNVPLKQPELHEQLNPPRLNVPLK
jgi:hypothetical protein